MLGGAFQYVRPRRRKKWKPAVQASEPTPAAAQVIQREPDCDAVEPGSEISRLLRPPGDIGTVEGPPGQVFRRAAVEDDAPNHPVKGQAEPLVQRLEVRHRLRLPTRSVWRHPHAAVPSRCPTTTSLRPGGIRASTQGRRPCFLTRERAFLIAEPRAMANHLRGTATGHTQPEAGLSAAGRRPVFNTRPQGL